MQPRTETVAPAGRAGDSHESNSYDKGAFSSRAARRAEICPYRPNFSATFDFSWEVRSGAARLIMFNPSNEEKSGTAWKPSLPKII